MLKFNTFRSQRYLRSRFVEGKFLLASEGSDIELELIDLSRKSVKTSIGNVFIDDAFKVERISSTEVLVRLGEAWFEGLPFSLRSAKDQLVSGSILSAGIVPPGVNIIDDNTGSSDKGKIISFTNSLTPTATYRIVISAEEELVTSADDIFLKNATITEDTSQKIRVNYKINVVDSSVQSETPIPYLGDIGSYNGVNLVNEITVYPAVNGVLLSTNSVSGANLDGRDLELVIKNDPLIGGGNLLPYNSSDQEAFTNGKLIDSRGSVYHINAIFLDSDTTRTVIRVDKELGQSNPVLSGTSYKVRKRDVYSQNDSTGAPVGKLFLPIADLDWSTTDGIVHDSSVSDLRSNVLSQKDFQNLTNKKFDLMLTDGGVKSFNPTLEELNWSDPFTIINPHGVAQSIPSNTVSIMDGGTLAYEMDFVFGGDIERGNLSVTVTLNVGTTSTLVAADLSEVRIGNVIKIGTQLAAITAIDDVNNVIEVSSGLLSTGPAEIYLDSFGPGYAPSTPNTFILAARKNNKVWFENEVSGDSGFLMSQAYCFTDGVGTEVNCSPPTVVGGKTRISLNFSYVPGLNPNTANGQLEIFLNGQKIPRYIDSSLTPDASYVEVDSNTIDLDDDYSSFNIAVDVVKPVSVIDTSETNSLRLLNIYDFIVGSTIQVASGQATHEDLADAVSDLSPSGGVVCVISDTTVNDVITIPENVKIVSKNKDIVITLSATGQLVYTEQSHSIEKLHIATASNIVMLDLQSNFCTIKDCIFEAPAAGSATCIKVQGNGNHLGENLFTGVASPSTSVGIEYVAGTIENTASNNIFTT